MKKPVYLLVFLALAGLSLVFALPEQTRLLPSAVKLEWPDVSGNWVKVRDLEPSPQEIAILAADTVFSKAQFYDRNSRVTLEVGIVLSGDDVNDSIHRPERCLIAQGHSGLRRKTLDIPLAGGGELPVTRLHTRIDRQLPSEDGTPRRIAFNSLTYYWFVGHEMVTSSHYARTFKDVSDRLIKGSNQRWAYITLSAFYQDPADGREPPATPGDSDGPLDAVIQDFIGTVIPGMLDREMLPGLRPAEA